MTLDSKLNISHGPEQTLGAPLGDIPLSLPDPLNQSYVAVSCLKYADQTATYLLRQKSTERLVLLKTASDPLLADSLTNENHILEFLHQQPSRLAATFPTPLELMEDQGVRYYVRTYIKGKTLEELCESNYKKPGLPPQQALDYIISLTELLNFLHTLHPPVIHRDIKPQNVVVDEEGVCHFIDLGISRFYQTKKRSDTLIMGTRLTAPPEQFGYQQTDIRSDLYSLGILLLYCITGEYEVSKINLTELEPPIRQIIQKATMFDPGKRYQTTAELLPDLLTARYSGIAAQRPKGLRQKFFPRRLAAAASLALNLCLASVVLYQGAQLRQSPPVNSSKAPGTESQATDGQSAGSTEDRTAEGQNAQNTADGQNAQNAASETAEGQTAVNGTAGDNLATNPDTVYTFREPLIEEAVREILSKPSGDITASDLAKVTQLHIMGLQFFSDDSEIWFKGEYPYLYDDTERETGLYLRPGPISSLEDILHMPNLAELSLYGQQISDISLLEGTKIKKLGLGYNPLTDLTPLEGNSDIEYLRIPCLPITDTKVLSTLPNLRTLDIGSTGITSLSGLENCSLESLNLFSVDLEDFSDIRNLPQLSELSLYTLNKDMLNCMEGLPLTRLEFNYSHGLTLKDFSLLPELRTLFYTGDNNTVLSAKGAYLPKLESLNVVFATIEDFREFDALSSLTILYLYGADVKSYRGLDQIPNLKRLICTEEQTAKIQDLFPEKEYIFR